MVDINLSKAVRSNLSSLQSTATLMNKTSDRLSTGNKVNSALDNPTNFFTASSLNSRAGDLNQLMDSMANGIKTIEAADNGLSSITKTLESMQSTLRQARQDKTFQTSSFTIDAEALKAGAAGGSISFAGGAIAEGDSASFSIRKAIQGTSTAAARYEAPAAAGLGTGPALAANDTYADQDFSTANTVAFTIQGPGDSAAVSISLSEADFTDTAPAGTGITLVDDMENVTQAEMVSALNVQLGESTSSVRARVTAGNIEFYDSATASATNTGADAEIAIAGTTANLAKIGFDDTTAADLTAAGEDADPITLQFNVNGVAIELTSTEDTAEKAAKKINDTLAAAATPPDVTASVKNGKLVLTGSADGTTAPTLTASATAGHTTDLATVFGTPVTKAAVAENAAGADVKSIDELVSSINAKTLENGDANPAYGKIRASNDNGKLRIENLSTQELDITGVGAGALTGTSSTGEITGNVVRADLAKQFNELRDQLDKLSDDASFNGINLLRGDKLTLTFNETGTSSIDIQAKDEGQLNAAKLGVFDIKDIDLDSDTNIDSLLSNLKTAMNDVRSQASAFGSNLSIVQNRQDFTQKMINTLETGAGNLTLADMNQEAANMMALQTRQSLASSTLSMANQADQSVLQLLR